jgi:signal transduction histidine kinase
VSHDLKSPLVTVKTFLDYIEKDFAAGDMEKVRKDLYFMHNAADRMNRLLTDLLQISLAGSVAATAERTPLQEIVGEALTIVAGSIAQHGATVKVEDVPVTLLGDRARLVEIWQNLIDNAIKYRQPQVAPVIEIGLDQTAEGPVFYVGDNGVGIDPAYHERIFELFNQLNPGAEGSGLGLALVRRIVEKSKGRIWVESGGGGTGSRFRFTLPAAINNSGGA